MNNSSRTTFALTSLLMLPTALAVDTLISLARGWRPGASTIAVIGAIGLWLVIAILISAWPRARRICARKWAQLSVLLVFAIISWAFLELALAVHFRDLRWLDRE